MPAGFHCLIAAQFASALADNALLIVMIALLDERGHPAWWAPLLKLVFTLAYVLLAPLVGPLADSGPKARLMAWMNALKMLGLGMILAGIHPLLGFAVVGVAAAAYAPAKYGLITELVGPTQLVRANAWIEVSVVLAALAGTVLGGGLVSETWRAGALATRGMDLLAGAGLPPTRLALSLLLLWAVYLLAGLLNLGVPASGARYPGGRLQLGSDFWRAQCTLWRDADGGLSLAVTTLFWGVGATLQFAVLRWAIDVLGLSLSQGAYLQAVVAVGVVLGAAVAGRLVGIGAARRMLPLGVLLGGCIALAALSTGLGMAICMLALVGLVGGLLVVPLNALLQHRGHQLLTAGRSIAVQGFNENLSVLLMLSGYAAMLAWRVPIVPLMVGFGLGIGALVGWLWWRSRR
ncbi:MAG: lysophospholipid transporter LplT [Ideonella sp.]|nr:lysophospholipid transporter LplT [Ideonella sp.]